MMDSPRFSLLSVLLLCSALSGSAAQQNAPPPIVGRWDLTVSMKDGLRPSWLEVERSGHRSLTGRFVGVFGSARPVAEVKYSHGRISFEIPAQWEGEGKGTLRLQGRISKDRLSGRIFGPFFEGARFTGVRAPGLKRFGDREWAEPMDLFNGKSMAGWKPRDPKKPNGWQVRNGMLSNVKPGNDIVTERKFSDFKLHVEFRYPKGSNSGVYLRGRYEVQIEDNYGKGPSSHFIGGVYGFIEPRANVAKRPGEWQTYDITLVGRYVTVVHNGQTIIDRQRIPGPTGGALDSDEGSPGPILLQGDHGPIEIRKITITPTK